MKIKIPLRRSSSPERREKSERRTEMRREHHRVSLVKPTDRRLDSRREDEKKK
jgi:hypothetical protein